MLCIAVALGSVVTARALCPDGAWFSRQHIDLLCSVPYSLLNSWHATPNVMSNGTHEFRETMILISVDGLRQEYLERGLTPHLLEMSKKGLRADYLNPIFPTLTFPNHWTLMTGLWAESHGLVANKIFDPVTKKVWLPTKKESFEPEWWFGEPMWETAQKAGLKTADIMWPGPRASQSGATPTYSVPFNFSYPIGAKLDRILEWMDMPIEERPQLIIMYEPSLDNSGHETGPHSLRTNQTLAKIDSWAGNLTASLQARNLSDIVNVVILSDHGMADTSAPELIYMDEILGEDFVTIEYIDGWPSMGLHLFPEANASRILEKLYAAEDPTKFEVFTRETMPARRHYANNPRIAPIFITPHLGYALTTTMLNGTEISVGNHGWDNIYPDLRAVFLTQGPFADRIKTKAAAYASGSTRSEPDLWQSTGGTGSDGYVMTNFDNIEIYNLAMHMLGIQDRAASNNGTEGFWDAYV